MTKKSRRSFGAAMFTRCTSYAWACETRDPPSPPSPWPTFPSTTTWLSCNFSIGLLVQGVWRRHHWCFVIVTMPSSQICTSRLDTCIPRCIIPCRKATLVTMDDTKRKSPTSLQHLAYYPKPKGVQLPWRDRSGSLNLARCTTFHQRPRHAYELRHLRCMGFSSSSPLSMAHHDHYDWPPTTGTPYIKPNLRPYSLERDAL